MDSWLNHSKGIKRALGLFTSFICLAILLDSTKTGASAQGVNIIRYQTVLLRNKNINGYLVLANSYDHDRTHVSVAKDIVTNQKITVGGGLSHGGVGLNIGTTVPLGYSSESARWNLVPRGNGEYEIIHSGFNEPLYAASNGFSYDNDRRRVLTWKRGPSVSQGFWKFEEVSNGFYRIKNTAHNEYLYAADYPSKGWVFTWRGGNIDSDQFHWQVVNP